MNEVSMQTTFLPVSPTTAPQIAPPRSRAQISIDTCAAMLGSSGRFVYARIPSMEDVRKLLLNLSIVAGVLFAAAIIGKASFRSYITIDAIAVPKSVSDRGLSGDIIAQRLLDEITEVGRISRVKHSLGEFSTFSFDRTLPKIDLPVGGISLGTVVASLRDFFGLIDTKIAGEVVVDDDASPQGRKKYWLRLRINDRGAVYRQTEATDDLDTVFREAALQLVERFDPHIAAAYYYANNDYTNALRMVRAALDDGISGNDPEAMNLRGMVARDQEKYEDALAQFQSLRARFPGFVEAQHNIAATLLLQGLYPKALAAAEEGIRLDPDHATGYSNAGSAMYSLGNHDAALAYFEKSASLDPTAAVALINQAAVYSGRPKPDYAKSIALYQRAADLDPQEKRVFINWAWLLRKLDKPAEARGMFERAIKAAPSSPIGYDQLGHAWFEDRKWDMAAEQYRKAVERAPKELPYRYHLASALREGGNLDESEKALLQVIEIKPDAALAYASLAVTRAEMLRSLRHNMTAESGFEWTRANDLANAFEARIADLLGQAKQLAPQDAGVQTEVANAYALLEQRDVTQELSRPAAARNRTAQR